MTVPEEVEELIADAPLSAHLATAAENRPHVAPVWYGYRDGVVSVLTTGKKLANVRENPRIAISIEKQGDDGPEWSVSLLGTATIVEDPDRTRAARKRVFGKYRETDDEEDGEGTLVEIEVGSATSAYY